MAITKSFAMMSMPLVHTVRCSYNCYGRFLQKEMIPDSPGTAF